jgi:Alg9-like mannosyltransferase family
MEPPHVAAPRRGDSAVCGILTEIMPRDRQEGRAHSPGPRDALSSGALRLTIGILLATLAAKLLWARHYDGFLTGDDLEIVEGAARYALGLPYRPWSLRCEFHPLVLVAPLLAVLRIGGRPPDPATVAWLAALPTALASTVSIWLVYRLAPRFGVSSRGSAIAAALYALHGLPLGYGATPYPRLISTMLLLTALGLVLDPARFRPFLGGCLIGIAFAVRFSEGVLLAPFLLAALRTRRSLSTLVLGLAGFAAAAAVCVGGADAVTWGHPFQSLIEFFRILHASPPNHPWYWYGVSILHWAGPAAVILTAVALTRSESRLPLAAAAMIVVAYSAFAHKSYRYLQAAIPFLAILMALGFERWIVSPRTWRRWAAIALLLAAPAWGVERALSLLRDKSMDAVAAGRWICDRAPRAVLLEQAWAYGGILVLGERATVRDLLPRRPLGLTEADLGGVSVAAVYARDLSQADRELLASVGFREVARFARYRKPVVVFRRG